MIEGGGRAVPTNSIRTGHTRRVLLSMYVRYYIVSIRTTGPAAVPTAGSPTHQQIEGLVALDKPAITGHGSRPILQSSTKAGPRSSTDRRGRAHAGVTARSRAVRTTTTTPAVINATANA